MSARILLSQVFFTGNTLRFSNDTLSQSTGKIVQACFRYKSKSSTPDQRDKVSKEKSTKKKYRVVDKSTVEKLKTSYPKKNAHCKKVTVVGSGRAAVTSALALVATDTTKDVCMLGFGNNLKLQAEALDMLQASVYLNDPKIVATRAYADTKGSEICVIATGTEQGPNEDNYEFTMRNSSLIREIIPELMKYNPEAVYLMASDPVDVLTREAWLAGGMHQSRVFGIGTNLYSAMLRSLISSRLGVHASACHGIVLGQNNPCSNPCTSTGGVPVWSGTTVRGVRLVDVNPEIGTESDPEKWQDSYESMIRDEQVVRKLKGGYTWATALSVVDICQTILNNVQDIRPVSTFATGKLSLEEDVFLSLPCVLGSNGIVSVVKQHLSAKEAFLLRRDSRKVFEMQSQLQLVH